MKATKRIILYGNSLILESIGASLRRLSQFEVKTLNSPLPEALKLGAANSDILLFDIETTRDEAVFSLLGTNPRLLLIGISSDVNLVKIWSGRQERELSTQSLLELIKSEANDMSFKLGGDKDRSYWSFENE